MHILSPETVRMVWQAGQIPIHNSDIYSQTVFCSITMVTTIGAQWGQQPWLFIQHSPDSSLALWGQTSGKSPAPCPSSLGSENVLYVGKWKYVFGQTQTSTYQCLYCLSIYWNIEYTVHKVYSVDTVRICSMAYPKRYSSNMLKDTFSLDTAQTSLNPCYAE